MRPKYSCHFLCFFYPFNLSKHHLSPSSLCPISDSSACQSVSHSIYHAVYSSSVVWGGNLKPKISFRNKETKMHIYICIYAIYIYIQFIKEYIKIYLAQKYIIRKSIMYDIFVLRILNMIFLYNVWFEIPSSGLVLFGWVVENSVECIL